MPTYPALYTVIQDGDDGTANSVNSRLTEISDAVGRLGDGTDAFASPDITSFVNSEHLHAAAASGGQIPFDNLDTTGASAGEKWIADGAGGGSWTSGYPIISAVTLMARISDDGNRWLRCDGRTIGNGTSGGTARANDDMHDLFVHLWSEFTNTELVIQNSSGTPTTRGGTAELDWDADKRMPLLDCRGRIIAGMDDPTGSAAANRVTDAAADALGGSMGAETHALIDDELAEHEHSTNNILDLPGGGGIGGLTAGATVTSTVGSAGGDDPHNNMQPTIFLNYFIYTGN